MLGLATIAAKAAKIPEFCFKLDLKLTTIFATGKYNWRAWDIIEDEPMSVVADKTMRNEFLRAAEISRVYSRHKKWDVVPEDLADHIEFYEEHVRSRVLASKLER